MQSQQTGLEVAVIGISGRFPGSKNLEDFWKNLVNGVELTSVFSDSTANNTIKAGAVLDDVELFDAEFFGFNPREAETMDPQHRMFLECAWEALENAGYNSETETRPIGVYAGVGMGTYLLYNLSPDRELMESRGFLPTLIGVDKDYLPTRVSYKLNLTGPSVSVGTACSSSLVAVHLACQSLLSGECDMSLAAGVAVKVPQSEVTLSPNEIAAVDGHCRAFDAKASGTIGGNGIGVVVLKRLEDALADRDRIYAVIKGSAINNDGAVKVGYTAPSESGQTRAIRAAQIMAEVEPETITYLETHGTGTPLGDPIEVAAMTEAFANGSNKKGYCAIGSVKTNVGHLDAAAGITGLIKSVLALDRQLLPPTINFNSPNPQIDFANSPFYVNTKLSQWQTNGTPRRAGVSSFGIGGTNAHAILEEAPVVEKSSPSRARQLLLLSAKTSSALETATTNLVHHLQQHPEINLADVAYTLQVGRQSFNHRRMLVVEDTKDAIQALSEPQKVFSSVSKASDRAVVFMFPGQGSQYVNMARELYHSEPNFAQQVDTCCQLLEPQIGLDLRQILYPTEADAATATQQLQQTAITQPALFVIEYALAKLWISWGVHPVAAVGHSIGEYVAATLAGVFSLEEALALVAARGKLMQELPSGSMLAVPLSEPEVQPYLEEGLSVAVINSSSDCVVSGTTEAVKTLQNKLVTEKLNCRLLHTSHAFHSPMMEPILESFRERVAQVSLKAPQIPYISNVTGTWITTQKATSPEYWANHIRQTVRFEAGLRELFKKPAQVLLEVGSGRTLSKLAQQHRDKQPEQVVLSSVRHPKEQQSDVEFLLKTVGQLWLSGVQIDWTAFYAEEKRYRLPLPTYPFERQRYWIDSPQQAGRENKTLPATSQLWQSLVKVGQSQAATNISESERQTYWENRQWLDSLCAAYINLALRNLGAFSNSDAKYSLDDLCDRCQVIPRYRPLLSQWLQKLAQQEDLQQHEGQFTNLASCSTETVNNLLEEVKLRWKDSPTAVNLVERCGNNLAAVLTGKKEPLEFFDGFLYNFGGAENTNRESPGYARYSTIIRSLIEQIVGSLSSRTNLRIMEIGSGIGYVTEELLSVLPSQTQYTFADVGNSFFNEAKQKFNRYPFVECRALDINRPFTEQGYSEGSFDLVVAVKSVHIAQDIDIALQNVRSLLAPGGLLLVWEKTQQTLDLATTWALLMNPDREKRSLDNIYLSQEQWQEALKANGFVEVAGFPETAALGQQLLMARTDTKTARSFPLAFTTTIEPDTPQTLQISSDKKPDIADWFYTPSWKRCLPLNVSRSPEQKTKLGYCLVFVDEGSLGESILKRLETEGCDVVTVKIGKQFSRDRANNQNIYTIAPQCSEDYNALIEDLIALNLIPNTIVHLWNLTPQSYDKRSRLENLDLVQERGFYSLLFLTQALGKQNVTGKLQISVVSNNLRSVTGEETLLPEKATLLGTVRVIPQEYPNLDCRSIDVVLPEAGSWQEEKLVDCLLAEFDSEDLERVVAYRGLHRWLPALDRVRLNKTFDGTSRLRQGGVYLITGGLGAIGLEFASHLAKTVRAKLILTGRSAFPAKDEWEKWLNDRGKDNDVSRKIDKLQELEELGAEVLVVRADVADLEAMQRAISQAQKRFGQVNGVFHAAGVLGNGAIALKTREDAETVLASKVRGTLVLDAIFKDVELDFMILCSSRASIAPVRGQVSYASANNFLDAYAHDKTANNKTFTVAVNLINAWLGGGIAVEAAKKLAPPQNVAPPQLKSTTHPLFDRCIVEGSDKIYISTFSASKHWFLDEHRFQGKAILPGTAYLEMALAACGHHSQPGTPEIRDVTFLSPLAIADNSQSVEVRTHISKQGDEFKFLITSQSAPESQQWLDRATGKIVFTKASAPKQHPIREIEASFKLEETLSWESTHQPQRSSFKFGERWNNFQQVRLGKDRGFAALELPQAYRDDIDLYELHPALLDRATGFPILKFQDDSVYLPFYYKKLRIEGSLPPKIYSYVRAVEENGSPSDILKFNITITDERGTELIEIEEFTIKKIGSKKTDSPSSQQSKARSTESENFYLTTSSPGDLNTLTLRSQTRQKPDAGEVEIEVSATGLNFKEVLFALGLIPVAPDSDFKLGLECAGKIVAIGKGVEDFAVGDEVIAFGSSCFSRFVTTSARLVVPKPEFLSLFEAATIPISFTTAYYALIKMGRLCRGEKVLIHAATGGVGMAAVQIAKWIGAQIFATAGSPEKRQFLHSLGIDRVMDSRSVAFADEVMQYTDGKGVDVVLNSLGGEFIPKGLSCLARYGRFLELGQRDILNNNQLGLGVFEKCISFFAIQANPELPNFGSLWREVVLHFQNGHLKPLPHQVFPMTEVAEAFKYMAVAKHIGKVVISLEDREAIAALLQPEAATQKTRKSVAVSSRSSKLASEPQVSFLKNGLSPSEGIEVFSRILGSTLPQVLVSTTDLQLGIATNNTVSQKTSLKQENPNSVSSERATHSRPELGNTYIAPTNEIETKLAAIWQEILGIGQVGIYDNFFELKGDSLLATQVVSQINEKFQSDLSTSSLFEAPTVAALAEKIPTSTSNLSAREEIEL